MKRADTATSGTSTRHLLLRQAASRPISLRRAPSRGAPSSTLPERRDSLPDPSSARQAGATVDQRRRSRSPRLASHRGATTRAARQLGLPLPKPRAVSAARSRRVDGRRRPRSRGWHESIESMLKKSGSPAHTDQTAVRPTPLKHGERPGRPAPSKPRGLPLAKLTQHDGSQARRLFEVDEGCANVRVLESP